MFYALRNLFALIGFACVVVAIYGAVKLAPLSEKLEAFDPQAGEIYMEMIEKVIETGNAAEATIWKVPVEEGLSPEDVEEAMRSVANELNVKNVGELPLSNQVELMTGKKIRFLKIYMFCNPLTAINMMNYSDAYSAYLPCRVALVEDKQGKLALYALNMDAMLHGGHPLPADLLKEAEGVKNKILDIMHRGAAGDF